MKICRKQLQGIAYLYSYCIQIHSERSGFHTVKNRQMFLWSCIFVRFIFSYELFYGGSLSKYLIRTQIKTIWKNARKNLFAVRLVEHWNKLLREGCEVSFFWRYLKPNWTQSWASCSGWLCEQEAELEGLLLTSAILWWESLWGVLRPLLTAPNDKWFGRGWELS